jgi:hypothetical protein
MEIEAVLGIKARSYLKKITNTKGLVEWLKW